MPTAASVESRQRKSRLGGCHADASRKNTWLKATFKEFNEKFAGNEIRLVLGQRIEWKSAERDQGNASEAWPEHGLL